MNHVPPQANNTFASSSGRTDRGKQRRKMHAPIEVSGPVDENVQQGYGMQFSRQGGGRPNHQGRRKNFKSHGSSDTSQGRGQGQEQGDGQGRGPVHRGVPQASSGGGGVHSNGMMNGRKMKGAKGGNRHLPGPGVPRLRKNGNGNGAGNGQYRGQPRGTTKNSFGHKSGGGGKWAYAIPPSHFVVPAYPVYAAIGAAGAQQLGAVMAGAPGGPVAAPARNPFSFEVTPRDMQVSGEHAHKVLEMHRQLKYDPLPQLADVYVSSETLLEAQARQFALHLGAEKERATAAWLKSRSKEEQDQYLRTQQTQYQS